MFKFIFVIMTFIIVLVFLNYYFRNDIKNTIIMRTLIVLVALSLSVVGCKDHKNPYESIQAASDTEAQTHPGKTLMETNCYVCHSPTASHDNRIGPPMIAVKKHYINDSTTKDAFIKAMQAWVKNPNEADAKMPGAIRRFGLMPKAYYPEETIEKIADYIYENDIDQPEWFESHYNEMRGKKKGKGRGNGKGKKQGKQNEKQMVSNLSHADLGLRYALGTKAVLGKNLMTKIQREGTAAALEFCNENAYHLTDSMATEFKASIKRVTDKPRNQNNMANAEEMRHINNFKQVIANKEEPQPISETKDGLVHVYYPIVTNTMCLQCHGKPKTNIAERDYRMIKQLYPKDLAVGYSENEVRGIWHVTFTERNE
jgi:cytochrome c553